jgi:voltage-gated potassium channel Kch
MENMVVYPARNLIRGSLFMLLVWIVATVGYMRAGWNFQDSIYMVTLTVFSVGYGEVHPIDTNYLHSLTMGTMAFGCTGMIFLSGALIQFMTLNPLQQIFGVRRMQSDIDKLSDHIIVCGYGRIGIELAKALKDAGAAHVILEQNDRRVQQARDAGHLCIQGDATSETALQDAGIERARVLASVLPNDAANVFITLSARNMNRKIEIIARGDAISTERKLVHAGANKVVLPTHIGAERIAEMILFPETARYVRESPQMQELDRTLRNLGLAIEVVIVPKDGAFFVVQINRRNGDTITDPDKTTRVEGGDGVVAVGRSAQAINAMFAAPPRRSARG